MQSVYSTAPVDWAMNAWRAERSGRKMTSKIGQACLLPGRRIRLTTEVSGGECQLVIGGASIKLLVVKRMVIRMMMIII